MTVSPTSPDGAPGSMMPEILRVGALLAVDVAKSGTVGIDTR
jgi:hypothetical protein